MFETLSLMVDIYQAVDFGSCDGLVLINNILILLLRDNLSMCVHCERDLISNLKNYLFSILRQDKDTVCPSVMLCRLFD